MISPPLRPNTYHCRCPLCSRSFLDLTTFDAHQRVSATGDVRCLDPLDRGMVFAGGFWRMPDGGRDAHSDRTGAPPRDRSPEQDLHQGALPL